MLHPVINITDESRANNIFSARRDARIARSTLFRFPDERSTDDDIFVRGRGKIEKGKHSARSMHAHTSKYRWFRWFRVPDGCSSTRSAAVMNTRRSLMRFSRDSVCSVREIYDEAVYTWPRRDAPKKKKEGKNLVTDDSKGPHRKIVDAHP